MKQLYFLLQSPIPKIKKPVQINGFIYEDFKSLHDETKTQYNLKGKESHKLNTKLIQLSQKKKEKKKSLLLFLLIFFLNITMIFMAMHEPSYNKLKPRCLLLKRPVDQDSKVRHKNVI